MDKVNANRLYEMFKNHIAVFADENNLEIVKCRATFTKVGELSFNIKFVEKSQQREVFATKCFKVGADPAWYNRTFEYDGKQYTVRGIDSRRHKYPIICKSNDNAMCFTVASIRMFMA